MMARDVYVVGVGMAPFGQPDAAAADLGFEAGVAALDDAGIQFREVGYLYNGYISAGLLTGITLAKDLGLTGIPMTHVENASATGSCAFHEAVQALAGNQWLSDVVGNLRKVLSLSRHRSLSQPGRIQQSCAEHLAIFAALKARDCEAAQALAHTHLMRQLEALRALSHADAGDPASSAPIVIEEPAHVRTRQSRSRARRAHA